MLTVKPAGKLVGTTWRGRLVRLSGVAVVAGLGVSAHVATVAVAQNVLPLLAFL